MNLHIDLHSILVIYVGDFVSKDESEMIYGFYQTSRFLIEEKEE